MMKRSNFCVMESARPGARVIVTLNRKCRQCWTNSAAKQLLSRRQPLAHEPFYDSGNQLVELNRDPVKPRHHDFAFPFEIAFERRTRDLFRGASLARPGIELVRL